MRDERKRELERSTGGGASGRRRRAGKAGGANGSFGGFLLGLIDGGNNRVWKRSGAGGVLQCKGQRWSYPELERRPGAV